MNFLCFRNAESFPAPRPIYLFIACPYSTSIVHLNAHKNTSQASSIRQAAARQSGCPGGKVHPTYARTKWKQEWMSDIADQTSWPSFLCQIQWLWLVLTNVFASFELMHLDSKCRYDSCQLSLFFPRAFCERADFVFRLGSIVISFDGGLWIYRAGTIAGWKPCTTLSRSFFFRCLVVWVSNQDGQHVGTLGNNWRWDFQKYIRLWLRNKQGQNQEFASKESWACMKGIEHVAVFSEHREGTGGDWYPAS